MVWKEILDKTKEIGGEALDKAKELGERAMGRGAQVDFRQEIDAKVSGGTNRQDAEKESFLERVKGVGQEAKLSGAIDYRSEDWRNFDGALNELLSDDEQKWCRQNAENPSIYRRVNLPSPSSAEYDKAKSYFKAKFKGEAPGHAAVNDMASNVNLMNRVSRRIFNELSPMIANGMDIKDILATHPEMGADIGMARMLKEQMEQGEERFGREQLHKKEFEQFKETAGDSLKDMLWSAPTKFLGDTAKVMKNIIKNPGPENVMKGFFSFGGAVLKFAGKELTEGTKLAYGGTRATLAWLNTLR